MHRSNGVHGCSTNGIAPPRTALEIFELLDSRTRLEILAAVAHHPLTVTQLAAVLHRDAADVSRQLQVLRASGLVLDSWAKKEHVHAAGHPREIRLVNGSLAIFASAQDGSTILSTCAMTPDLADRLRGLNGTGR